MSSAPNPPKSLSAAELFKQHAQFVARFLVHLGVAAVDLDDVLQEVFLVVHARGGYVPGPAKPTSYLGSIAVRAAHSYRRRQRTQRTRESEGELDELPTQVRNPGEQLEADERTLQIRAVINGLPEELRIPLLLVEMEGESCSSVAASMGCPVGTIYWRLHTARKQFTRAMSALQETQPPRATALQKGWRP